MPRTKLPSIEYARVRSSGNGTFFWLLTEKKMATTKAALLLLINDLDNDYAREKYGGCWATNSYLASVLNVAVKSIERLMSELVKEKWVRVTKKQSKYRILNSRLELRYQKHRNILLPRKRGSYSLENEGVTTKSSFNRIKKNNSILGDIEKYPKSYLKIAKKLRDKTKHMHKNPKPVSNKTLLEDIKVLDQLVRLGTEEQGPLDFKTEILPVLKWTLDPSNFWYDKVLACTPLRQKNKHGVMKFDQLCRSRKVDENDKKRSNKITERPDCTIPDKIMKQVRTIIDPSRLSPKQEYLLYDNIDHILEFHEAIDRKKMGSNQLEPYWQRISSEVGFIMRFIEFIRENRWIRDISAFTFDPKGTIFQKFHDKLVNNMGRRKFPVIKEVDLAPYKN